MRQPYSERDIAVRCRMVLRAFTLDRPLPPGFVERMRMFDSGEDRSEEFWGPGYRLTRQEIEAEGQDSPASPGEWRNRT